MDVARSSPTLSPAPVGTGAAAVAGTAPTPASGIQENPLTPPEQAITEEKTFSPLSKVLKIRAEGNRNVKERVILAQVKTKRYDLYEAEKIRKDVQNIFSLGNFEDVTVEAQEIPGGIGITFKVVEKPLIKKIEFKGNKKLSKSKLLDKVTLKERDPLDKLKLNLDVEALLALYKDEGFAAAQVEPYTSTTPDNFSTVTFYITEGTQVLIEKVILTGVTAFPEKKVRKLLKTKRKKVFKQDQLTKDLEEVTRFYKNNGFLNVVVGEPRQSFNAEKNRLTIEIPITEGTLLRFGDTDFTGNAIFEKKRLFTQVAYKPGDIYSQEKMDGTEARLRDLYGELGYIRTRIEHEFTEDKSSGTVNIRFSISEGEVVYVEHIGIEGNTHTKEFVLRREIKLKPGEPFSSVLARKSVERLYNLGFLDNVDIDVQQPNSPRQADVIFTVTEGKPGTLSAGAGYSSVDGLIGTLQVQHINFLGRAQRLNVQWEFGKRRNSFNVGWQDPWFLGKPLTFGVDLFNTIRRVQRNNIRDAYKTRDRGFGLTAGPRFSDVYSLLFSYSLFDQRIFDVANDPATRQAILGTTAPTVTERNILKSNLTPQFIRDTRDNQFDPTRGQRTSVATLVGGLFPAKAINYYRPSVDHSIHIPTFWKFVLSLHGNWAVIKPYGTSTRSDIDPELFRLGGPDTIRGYDVGRVGYRDGAEIQNVYNVEYKFPIAPDERGKTLLQGVLFYDIGGSWNRVHEINYNTGSGPNVLKQGVGFGIRFKTPVFPLRLDYGIPLNRAPDDKTSQFYFTVGSLF